ncbi:MAG: asparagine synthase (glutamine-hydrolyzing), partial [Candidatus Tectomicrobia bacterium]|nr:asparagine synthase (glutamine-hydrolyzing) [Candidatus Tectomicrobia bacterium]
ERVETFLGSTRLAILDLSANGHQPMPDPATGNWISFNGEIYNFRELLAELKIADPRLTTRSQTDTEVILKAYARWGRDCVRRLRGMFAFALWDQGRQELFLARDRLGIKPLYYYDHEGTFLFASEVRAILASGLVLRRLDPVGVWGYLAYQSVPAPRTLIQGIRVLPPGSWMTVDSQGTITGGRYWDLLEDASPDARSATREECRRRVRDLLREAISIHLVSDVPLGIFLSGGIDSSTVVALMCELGQVPRTFSVIFREQAYNEARHAQQVASRFHTDHVEILLGEQDLLTQLPEALAAMDQPTGDGVNTYVISRAVRSAGLTVALSGLGGDEFFGGYPSFRRLSKVGGLLRLWGRTPRAFRSLAGWMVEALGRSSVTAIKLASLVKSDGTLDATFPVTRQVFSDRERHALLENGWISEGDGTRDSYVQLLKEAYDRAPESELFSRVSYGEARTYMHDVLLRDTDQMSMAHALEVRVPLLDHKLVEYVMGLPDAHKRPNGTPKRLLVESLDGLLPKEIVRRPKQGFTLPFEPWMRGDFRGFCEERLGPERLGGRGLFRPERLQSLWQDFLAGRRHVSWARLWLLVALEEWLERNGVEL